MNYLNDSIESVKKLNSQQIIKEKNIKWLFDLINDNRELTRAGLVRITKLSPTTVSSLVDELVALGLVVETGQQKTNTTGRKPIKLQISEGGRQIPVFSLNRWGIRYTLYDLYYNELETYFAPHMSDQYGGFEANSENEPDSGSDYADLIYNILNEQAKKIVRDKVVAICISSPGLFLEKEEVIAYSALRVRIFVGNSSMCFAYAEKKYLNRHNEQTQNLIYLNVTDGIGAGIVYKDEIFTGPLNTAGEVGHLSIDYAGEKCQTCGSNGCLESNVNTRIVIESVKQSLIESPTTLMLDLLEDSYDNLTLEMIGEAYNRGIEPVVNAVDKIANKLFIGIYGLLCITGIPHIVIGGGIERLGSGFLNKLVWLANGKRKNYITKDLQITYTRSGFKGDSLGIAEYLIDRAFSISL